MLAKTLPYLDEIHCILYNNIKDKKIDNSMTKSHRPLITQDLMLYRVPTDLEILMQILVGTLTQN